MRLRWLGIPVLCSCILVPLFGAPPPISPRNLHERVIVVVPMIGKGTPADPKRPLFAPVPAAGAKPTRAGIFGFSYQLSDDGLFAIVELVADNPQAFAPILADKQVLKAFEKGKVKKTNIEVECKKFKKDFSLDKFGMGVR